MENNTKENLYLCKIDYFKYIELLINKNKDILDRDFYNLISQYEIKCMYSELHNHEYIKNIFEEKSVYVFD